MVEDMKNVMHKTLRPATSIHLPRGLSRARWREALTAGWRLLLDSERLADVLIVEEITAKTQLRHLLDSGALDHGDGADLMRDRPDFIDVDFAKMRALPDGTLGRELARFFDDNGLDTKLYGVPAHYTEDEDAAYLMQRLRQCHDLWHVLMGFGVDPYEEILVHAFSLAQTGLPSSTALIALGGIKHLVLERRWWALRHGLLKSHRRGRQAAPLLAVYWERYLDEPLSDVRERLNIQPWTASDRASSAPGKWRAAA